MVIVIEAGCLSGHRVSRVSISPRGDRQTLPMRLTQCAVGQIKSQLPVHFAFFSPALSGSFNRLARSHFALLERLPTAFVIAAVIGKRAPGHGLEWANAAFWIS